LEFLKKKLLWNTVGYTQVLYRLFVEKRVPSARRFKWKKGLGDGGPRKYFQIKTPCEQSSEGSATSRRDFIGSYVPSHCSKTVLKARQQTLDIELLSLRRDPCMDNPLGQRKALVLEAFYNGQARLRERITRPGAA
jgi:hypothetical protein